MHSSPAQVSSVKPGLMLVSFWMTHILLGVSLATQIIDNPFGHARAHSSTAAPVQHNASSDFTDPKRLLYRALMLRGMGCRPAESQSYPPCQQSAMQPEICEKAREIVRQVISGSSIDSVSSIDRTLQRLALEQVNTSRQKAVEFSHLMLQAESIASNISNRGEGGISQGDASAVPAMIAPSTVKVLPGAL